MGSSSDAYSTSQTSFTLLARVRESDQEAWQGLVSIYGPLVFYWCRQYQLSESDVADIVQEVFLAVHRSIQRFDRDAESGSFRGWLLTITRNKVMDLYRRRAGEHTAPGGSDAQRRLRELPDPELSLLDSDSSPVLGRLLHRALERIRDEFAESTWTAFWRVTIDGRSPQDVAEELQVRTSVVYNAKSRVLKRLRSELGDGPP